MDILKALFDLFNGKKMSTGTIMIIAVIVLKTVFHIQDSEANTIATNIMMGVGGTMALWGYIHQWIKSAQAKKAAVAAPVTK